MIKQEPCPACGGAGSHTVQVIIGHVSRDMASDAGDMSFVGTPVFGVEEEPCPYCEGTGIYNEAQP